MIKFFKRIIEWLFGKKKEKIIFKNEFNITWLDKELYILKLINDYREENNLTCLKADDTFYTLAQTRNTLNINKGKISHDNFSNVTKVLTDLGISWAGENLAYGYKNVDSAINAWKKSEGHNKNILKKDWIYTGISISQDKDGNNYYCQLFGR